MINDGAIYMEVSRDSSMMISTVQMTDTAEGGQKKVALSKWKTKYMCGRNRVEKRIQDHFATKKAGNLLWEHEETLRLWDQVSNYGKIIWVESHSKESIHQSFVEVAKQLGIGALKDADEEQEPEINGKVYSYLYKKFPIYRKGTVYPILVIFCCSKQQNWGCEVVQNILDYFPPSDHACNSCPSVLIMSEAIPCWTVFTELPAAELDEFVSEFNEIESPGQQSSLPQQQFLLTLGILCDDDFGFLEYDWRNQLATTPAYGSTEIMPPEIFKSVALKALREFCETSLLRGGTHLQLTARTEVKIHDASGSGSRKKKDADSRPCIHAPHSKTQPAELREIHNFFMSRRRADTFSDKTLILSTNGSMMTAREYVEVHGNFYNAVVQLQYSGLGELKTSFLEVARDQGLHDGHDYRVVNFEFVAKIYEHFDHKFGGNVLFVFQDVPLGSPYSDLSSMVHYLPLHALPSGQCPFTLITIAVPVGVIKQPSSNSRTFSDSSEVRTMGQTIQDCFEKPAAAQLSASSVIGFLLSYTLYGTSDQDAQTLLQTELLNVDFKFEDKPCDYDSEAALEQLKEAVADPRDAVVWAHRMNAVASKGEGKRALSFLWDISHLPEDSSNSSASLVSAKREHHLSGRLGARARSCFGNMLRRWKPAVKDSKAPESGMNVYSLDLQPSFLGPEYKNEIEQTLDILRKCSFVRVFNSDNGRLTVMMPAFVRNVVKYSPCNSKRSEVNTTLLLLANVGQVQLKIDQYLNLRSRNDCIATDIFYCMRKISIDSSHADPYFQVQWTSYCDGVENELRKLPSYGKLFFSDRNKVTCEMIGIKAEGNVVVHGDMSVVFSSSGPVVHGFGPETSGGGKLCERQRRGGGGTSKAAIEAARPRRTPVTSVSARRSCCKCM